MWRLAVLPVLLCAGAAGAATAPLTVLTSGYGSVMPGSNGKFLTIGQRYTLTAAPASGYAFTNWTLDRGGPVATNTAAIRFIMQSNLVLAANFVLRPDAGLLHVQVPDGDRGWMRGTNLAFVGCMAGAIHTQRVVIANRGAGALQVTGLTVPTGFKTDCRAFTVPGGGSSVVAVAFAPITVKSYDGQLKIVSSSAAGGDAAVRLLAYGEPPASGVWQGRWLTTNLPAFALSLSEGDAIVRGKVYGRDGTGAPVDADGTGSVWRARLVQRFAPLTGYGMYGRASGILTGAVNGTTLTGAFVWDPTGIVQDAASGQALPIGGTRWPVRLTRAGTSPMASVAGSWQEENDAETGTVTFTQYGDRLHGFGTFCDGSRPWTAWFLGSLTNFNEVSLGLFDALGRTIATNVTGVFDGADRLSLLAPDGSGGQTPISLRRTSTTAPALHVPFPAPAGLDALADFFATNAVPDRARVADAARAFAALSASDPSNAVNHIYCAIGLLLNLINDQVLRDQALACGLTIDDPLHPSLALPLSGLPTSDDTADKLNASLLPVCDRALAELAAVPDAWTGQVEVSRERFPIDESVWIDRADAAAMRASFMGLRATLGLLKANSLNFDPSRLHDPVATPQIALDVDGQDTEWSGVPVSLARLNAAGQLEQVRVALSGGQIAILVTGFLPPEATASSDFIVTLDVSVGGADYLLHEQRYDFDVYSQGSYCVLTPHGTPDGVYCPGLRVAVANGTLELLLPYVAFGTLQPADLAQVTLRSCEASLGRVSLPDNRFVMPEAVPLARWNEMAPDFLSTIRDFTALGRARLDLQAAISNYLAADRMVVARAACPDGRLHLVNYDAADAASVSAHEALLAQMQTVQTGLVRAVAVPTDSAVSPTGTERVFLGAAFNAPCLTTNRLPAGLRGTLRQPIWDAFADPTLGGILPDMTASKLNRYLRDEQFPAVSAATLNGASLDLFDAEGNRTGTASFGATAYCLQGTVEGTSEVGKYTYTRSATNGAALAFAPTAPANRVTAKANVLALVFARKHAGTWSRDDASGSFRMRNAGAPAPAVLTGRAIVLQSTNDTVTLSLAASTFSQTTPDAASGSYTYTMQSPAGGLLTLTFSAPAARMGAKALAVLTFDDTRHGMAGVSFTAKGATSPELQLMTFEVKP